MRDWGGLGEVVREFTPCTCFSIVGFLGSYHVYLGMCILFIYWLVILLL